MLFQEIHNVDPKKDFKVALPSKGCVPLPQLVDLL